MAWNAFHYQKVLEIVGRCYHPISNEIVQDVHGGNNSRMSALFWILTP